MGIYRLLPEELFFHRTRIVMRQFGRDSIRWRRSVQVIDLTEFSTPSKRRKRAKCVRFKGLLLPMRNKLFSCKRNIFLHYFNFCLRDLLSFLYNTKSIRSAHRFAPLRAIRWRRPCHRRVIRWRYCSLGGTSSPASLMQTMVLEFVERRTSVRRFFFASLVTQSSSP